MFTPPAVILIVRLFSLSLVFLLISFSGFNSPSVAADDISPTPTPPSPDEPVLKSVRSSAVASEQGIIFRVMNRDITAFRNGLVPDPDQAALDILVRNHQRTRPQLNNGISPQAVTTGQDGWLYGAAYLDILSNHFRAWAVSRLLQSTPQERGLIAIRDWISINGVGISIFSDNSWWTNQAGVQVGTQWSICKYRVCHCEHLGDKPGGCFFTYHIMINQAGKRLREFPLAVSLLYDCFQ